MTRRQIIWLVAILAIAFALRLSFLIRALQTPGYAWADPDGYMAQAQRLTTGGGWQWSFDAVTYTINHQQHALPPGYSVFLSLFTVVPGFPLSAQVAQVFLAVLATGLVFELGRVVHSPRTGLVAAAAYAIWIPDIFSVWSTSQEKLYIPLMLLALVVLTRAIDGNRSPARFGLAGVIFGAAALTRSMPIFFVVPAGLLHVALASERQRAVLQAAAFLAGFLLLTAPYSAALSRHFGQLTIIDTHGSIHLDTVSALPRRSGEAAKAGDLAPGLVETARALWRSFADDPVRYLAEGAARARSLLHVNGGRLLQIYVVADTKLEASAWKAAVHSGADVVLILAASLAAIGAALCQRPRIGLVLLLWATVNIGIASVGGFGGARLRATFEPLMMVLAAVVAAGHWRRPNGGWLILSLLVGLLAATAVLPQIRPAFVPGRITVSGGHRFSPGRQDSLTARPDSMCQRTRGRRL